MSSNRESVRHTFDNNSHSDILDAPEEPGAGLLAAAHASPMHEMKHSLLPDGRDDLPARGFAIADKKGTSCEAIVPGSPLRIVVRCLSHKIPGHRSDRTNAMANIICQYHFQRDMDRKMEQIRSLGLTEVDGKKVGFLLECGNIAPDMRVEDVPIKIFKWNGSELIPRNVDPRTRAYLNGLSFKYKPPVQKPLNPKTMAQMRASMDDKAWDTFRGEVILRKLQFKKRATTSDRSWAKERPALFYDVMQQFTTQQLWHGLELPPSQRQWVEAKKDRENPNTFEHLIDVVLDNMDTETDGEQSALRSTVGVEEPHTSPVSPGKAPGQTLR